MRRILFEQSNPEMQKQSFAWTGQRYGINLNSIDLNYCSSHKKHANPEKLTNFPSPRYAFCPKNIVHFE